MGYLLRNTSAFPDSDKSECFLDALRKAKRDGGVFRFVHNKCNTRFYQNRQYLQNVRQCKIFVDG